MSLYRCRRNHNYNQHAHHCPACIDYVATFLRAVTLDPASDPVTKANANRALVVLGRTSTPHQFTGMNNQEGYSDLCRICELPAQDVIHRKEQDVLREV